MKKFVAFTMALAMLICVGGCKSTNDGGSSSDVQTSNENSEIEYQQVYIDESGNEITSSNAITSSKNETASSQTDKTSSETQTSSKEEVSSLQTSGNTQTTSSKNETTNSTSSSNKNPVEIDYNTVVDVDICDDVIRGYLEADNASKQYHWLSTYSYNYSSTRYDYQKATLDWKIDFSTEYTVYFSEKSDFSNAYVVKTKDTTLKDTILVPGKTYYWKVMGTISNEPIGGGRIHINDMPVRWINVEGTGNVRDIGGWTTSSGKKVNYGKIYRGQKLDDVKEAGLATLKSLSIKTELDLRYAKQSEDYKNSSSACLGKFNYVFLETNCQYDDIFNNEDEMKKNYNELFKYLADESNYPVYLHCSGGADRTGTFAYLANGLLGVSYEDLTRDFELTSFSTSGKRWRGNGSGNTFGKNDLEMEVSGNYVAWGKLNKQMMEYGEENGCSTLQQSIEHYLVNKLGVPQSNIDSFKKIMLG